ncbi:zinc-binding alcohol dehydrogenase family protein [Lactococcus allomyrinae]|uniref:Zinc-type alcohol dehydrogenase-like protein n=1 Tax=Lactococcus allomyrinae TaxID=2419773 RepID=A0A387BFS0_9LACT|nr:zinc-binding alcohol dehydrogenase family protein [Lactococcus allomyrinae]AYF99759.1 zinc-binding alcohol dehydrogenase family protein [Lactococcus allomyrinae]
MKAIGTTGKSIHDFIEFELKKPELKAHDILVKVDGVSVNPVDTKIRNGLKNDLVEPKVLGWDGIGTVVEIGEAVTLFQVGDYVFWAGDVTRSGSNSEFQAVDERIVALAPKNLTAAEAVAMPLTSLTAYELLFEKLEITDNMNGKSILIINGAGGVGSVATQMAKNAGLTVIATASNQRAIDWVTHFGADFTVNHHQDLVEQVRGLGFEFVDYILILNAVLQHIAASCELIAPQGRIANIVEPGEAINLDKLAHKSASFSFEWMFTKSAFMTTDLQSQHEILTKISQWLDCGALKTTLTENLGAVSTDNIRKAHEMIEQGRTIGKIVLCQ